MCKKAKYPEPIIHGDGDNSLMGHALTIVARLRAITGYESATVKINQHGQAFFFRFGRCPDVQIEAVLAHAIRPETHVTKDSPLHAARSELLRLAHALPIFCRLWSPPQKIADW